MWQWKENFCVFNLMNNQIDLNILNGKEVSTEGDDNNSAQYKSGINFDFDAETLFKPNENEILKRKEQIKVPAYERFFGNLLKAAAAPEFMKIATDTLAEPFIFAAQRRRLAVVAFTSFVIGYGIAFIFVFVPI